MKLCKDCPHFHIRCEYKNPYEWGEAVCDKYNLITDFRTKKKFETLECVKQGGQRMTNKEADWKQAENTLNMWIEEYTNIGASGWFGLQLVLLPLKRRFDSGERTQELYDAIMSCE